MRAAAVDRRDGGRVDIEPDHGKARGSKCGAEGQPDVAEADHAKGGLAGFDGVAVSDVVGRCAWIEAMW